MQNTTTLTSFRAYDSNMPFIAANAAAEVDNLINNRSYKFDYIKKLSELLSKTPDKSPKSGNSRSSVSIMDPLSSTIFERAFEESSNTNLSSFDELNKKIQQLKKEINALIIEDNIENQSMLTSLRDFLIALSKYSLSYRQEYSSDNSKPSYQL